MAKASMLALCVALVFFIAPSPSHGAWGSSPKPSAGAAKTAKLTDKLVEAIARVSRSRVSSRTQRASPVMGL